MCLHGLISDAIQFTSVVGCAAPLFDSDIFLASANPYVGGLEPYLVEAMHLPERNLTAFFDANIPGWHALWKYPRDYGTREHCTLGGGLPTGPARSIKGQRAVPPKDHVYAASGAFQVQAQWMCEQMIRRHEEARGRSYTTVVAARTDLHWVGTPLLRLPPAALHDAKGCWVPCQLNDFGGLCDQFALCDRLSARLYLTRANEFPDAKGPTGWPCNFTDRPVFCNTECHVKNRLWQKGVTVHRFEAPFIRRCVNGSVRGSGGGICRYVAPIKMYGKASGNQTLVALDLMHESMRMLQNAPTGAHAPEELRSRRLARQCVPSVWSAITDVGIFP